jgi:hypothetical protein
MQFETKKLDTTQDDGNSIVITMEIRLTDKDAQDYIELDELLRNSVTEQLQEIVSDYGWTYSNNILSSTYWDRLSDVLEAVKSYLLSCGYYE